MICFVGGFTNGLMEERKVRPVFLQFADIGGCTDECGMIKWGMLMGPLGPRFASPLGLGLGRHGSVRTHARAVRHAPLPPDVLFGCGWYVHFGRSAVCHRPRMHMVCATPHSGICSA